MKNIWDNAILFIFCIWTWNSNLRPIQLKNTIHSYKIKCQMYDKHLKVTKNVFFSVKCPSFRYILNRVRSGAPGKIGFSVSGLGVYTRKNRVFRFGVGCVYLEKSGFRVRVQSGRVTHPPEPETEKKSGANLWLLCILNVYFFL